MLCAYLSLTKHTDEGKLDLNHQNIFNDEYMKIVARYANDRPTGSRPIDFMQEAFGALLAGIADDDGDPLGDVYMSAISFGEHGQYFTPYSMASMMAEITLPEIEDGQTVLDPSCGSGVMLIVAGKRNPRAVLYGIDLDERCAKMCALNLMLREYSGVVWCGNGLSGEMYTRWNISHGWVRRDDKPDHLEPRPAQDGQRQLTLL